MKAEHGTTGAYDRRNWSGEHCHAEWLPPRLQVWAMAAAMQTRTRISFNGNAAARLPVLKGGQTASFEEIGPARTQNCDKGELNMNDQNRVLIRKGARELDREETGRVGGSLGTLTACTWDPDFGKDGDASIGEC
ncbi:MAG: hypothetical protein WCE73_02580 [Candidatus Angelobacter sp.]